MRTAFDVPGVAFSLEGKTGRRRLQAPAKYDVLLRNIFRLVDDAELLFDARRYTSANALALYAMEEAGKYTSLMSARPAPKKAKLHIHHQQVLGDYFESTAIFESFAREMDGVLEFLERNHPDSYAEAAGMPRPDLIRFAIFVSLRRPACIRKLKSITNQQVELRGDTIPGLGGPDTQDSIICREHRPLRAEYQLISRASCAQQSSCMASRLSVYWASALFCQGQICRLQATHLIPETRSTDNTASGRVTTTQIAVIRNLQQSQAKALAVARADAGLYLATPLRNVGY